VVPLIAGRKTGVVRPLAAAGTEVLIQRPAYGKNVRRHLGLPSPLNT